MADYKEDTLDEIVDAKEPEAEVQPEPEPQEEAKAEPEAEEEQHDDRTVPLAALKEEREKRKADSERLKALEEELEAIKTPKQQQQERQAPPDMFEDPQGYNDYWETRLVEIQRTNQQQLLNERLDISERYARDKHGEDLVESAKTWALEQMKNRPAYQGEVLSQSDPYAFVVQEYQRDQMVSQLDPNEFEQFKAWKAAQESGAPVMQAPKTTANARTVARKAPEPFDADEALDDLLNKK